MPIEPIRLFLDWYKDAELSKVIEFNAMTLTTVNQKNQPSARVVYCKEANQQGVIFYTNYLGQKSQDIIYNPNVCVNFFWPEKMRQVRIHGITEKISRSENEKYFATRPRDSQIGAWASKQSSIICSYDQLRTQVNLETVRFENITEIPCPDYWGGFLIRPNYFEFWQGRAGRLHERECFYLQEQVWQTFLRSP